MGTPGLVCWARSSMGNAPPGPRGASCGARGRESAAGPGSAWPNRGDGLGVLGWTPTGVWHRAMGSKLELWELSDLPHTLSKVSPLRPPRGHRGTRGEPQNGAGGRWGRGDQRAAACGEAFGTEPRVPGAHFPPNWSCYQWRILGAVPGGTSSPSPPPTPSLSRSGPRQCGREGVGTIA